MKRDINRGYQKNFGINSRTAHMQGRLNLHLQVYIRRMLIAYRSRVASANEWRRARKRNLYPDIPLGAYADHMTPVVLLGMNTGLRRGELLALDWSDINLDARLLTVRRENAKSGKQRHVPLNAEALAVLKQWLSQTTDVGSVFGVASVKSGWESLLTAAKVENFRFHDLRHHFASRLVMGGVDLNTVKELLGHSDLTMTLRYAHLALEHLAAAVEKLAAYPRWVIKQKAVLKQSR